MSPSYGNLHWIVGLINPILQIMVGVQISIYWIHEPFPDNVCEILCDNSFDGTLDQEVVEEDEELSDDDFDYV